MTFYEICLDEISYNAPYLQFCTEKKVFENIFFMEKSPVQPLTIDEMMMMRRRRRRRRRGGERGGSKKL